MSKYHQAQIALPFAKAETSYEERHNMLGLALMRVDCDLHLRVFVEKVFGLTHGGMAGEVIKSYAEIAARPEWLCCSVRTAQRTVEKAIALKLVAGMKRRYASGSQRPNTYRIDWEGVKELLDLRRTPSQADSSTDGQIVTGPSQIVTGPSQIGHHTKEYKTSCIPSCNIRTGPEETEPKPMDGDEDRIPNVPELAEASARCVEPLPPGAVLYGAFKPVTEELLKRPDKVLVWFRQAIGVPSPVCSSSEAHLLLVLATARCAVSMAQRDVLKTRAAFFAATVSRRKWQRVLYHVPDARRQLDGMLERHGRKILEGPLPVAGGVSEAAETV